MNFREISGVLALFIALVSFIPYLRDIFARKTTPHIYSWLIWGILQITASLAILQENSLYSALGSLGFGLVSITVFFLSFKYGTKRITTFDTLCFVGALITIGVWVFLNNITLSVILVTVIDLLGFLPTYRKGYQEPYSETLFLFTCSAISNTLSLLAITHHSVSSSLYVASLVVTNVIFIIIVFLRRRYLRYNAKILK